MRLSVIIMLWAVAYTPAKAQMATFDASNLAQALMSYFQDADHIADNTIQFLENLGVLEEQLDNLKKFNDRFHSIDDYLYKGMSITRLAKNYETTCRMFTQYVNRLKSLEGTQLTYMQVRTSVNDGFQYLLLASREIKKAREFLNQARNLSPEKRQEGLDECDRQMARINRKMSKHIKQTYDAIDSAQMLNNTMTNLEESFSLL